MSKRNTKRRHFEIRKKQKRLQKLHSLREQYLVARTASEKKQVADRLTRLAPHLNPEKYLVPKG
jgi:hypothetical protein